MLLVWNRCQSPHMSDESGQLSEADGNAMPPPDGGYGWVCLACCFMVNCFTWGVVAVSYGFRDRALARLSPSDSKRSKFQN